MKNSKFKKDFSEIVIFIERHIHKDFIISILRKKDYDLDKLSFIEVKALMSIKQKILEKGWTTESSGIIMSSLSYMYAN